jgi:hypothetical protein
MFNCSVNLVSRLWLVCVKVSRISTTLSFTIFQLCKNLVASTFTTQVFQHLIHQLYETFFAVNRQFYPLPTGPIKINTKNFI